MSTVDRVVDAAWAELERQASDRTPWPYVDRQMGVIDGEIDMQALARAALAAMREPTEEMRAAAMAATGSDSALSPVTADGRCRIFTAMIDAALGDEK